MTRSLLAFLFPLFVGACASLEQEGKPDSTATSILDVLQASSAQDCLDHLDSLQFNSAFSDYNALPSTLDVLVWNTQKSYRPDWELELGQLSASAELVLFQEAMFETLRNAMPIPEHVAGIGYASSVGASGVLSASHVSPLASCSFSDWEPILRTPKASSIVQYALPNRVETLMVANVHAINFSLGMKSFETQLSRLVEVLAQHEGPILFVGDFNTWRAARLRLLEELMNSLEMDALEFDDDQRSRVFGYALDHVFMRGLDLVDARTAEVNSSDHNAILATFHLP